MKFIFVLFLIASFSDLDCQLIGESNFAPLGATWKYETWSAAGSGSIVSVEVINDTIIGNKYCTIISLIKDEVKIEESEVTLFESNDSIFFFEENEFFLLFNFSDSIKIGDTLEYYLPHNARLYDIGIDPIDEIENPFYYQVTEISTVTNSEGDTLKSYYVNSLVETQSNSDCNLIKSYIQNVGIRNGFFGGTCNFLPLGREETFLCYKNNEFVYSENSDSCEPSSIINKSEIIPNIYPNPTHSILYINSISQDLTCVLYDIRGNMVAKFKGNEIDISHLLSGMYLLRINTNYMNYTETIIIKY